jgi:hypothetical protein
MLLTLMRILILEFWKEDTAEMVFRMLLKKVSKKYFIFGLHENYTSKKVLIILKKLKIESIIIPMTKLVFEKKNFEEELVKL